MGKGGVNFQELLLNHLRKESVPVAVFLVSGAQLRGCIKGFDNFTLVLESEGKPQLVYKHAVASVVPQKTVPDLIAPALRELAEAKREQEDE
jgi:host factor-I protein